MSEWFDDTSGILNFDQAVAKNAHFQKILRDGVVTEQEVADQAKYVLNLLKHLDQTLSTHDRDLVRQLIEEMAVLSVIMQHQEVESDK